MASGSNTQGIRAPAESSSGSGPCPPQSSLKPDFVAMKATELIAYLKCHGRTSDDFDDAAAVFAERENRLAQAEQLVREVDKRMGSLFEGIAERDALIHQAAVTEERLRADIHALQQPRAANANVRAGHGSGTSGRGLIQQAVPARGEEVLPRKRPYRALRMKASPPEQTKQTRRR